MVSDSHYRTVIRSLAAGRVVPFLGAGVNLCGRPPGVSWKPDTIDFLPSGAELGKHLADSFGYPFDETWDLIRVSHYLDVMFGSGALYDALHALFDKDFPPTAVHKCFASIPNILTRKNYRSDHLLIATTNYDDVLERAFRAEGELFDVVYYVADGERRGMFEHLAPDGTIWLIDKPNEYKNLSLSERSIILKLHGAVSRFRANGDADNYVITEDHYIEYLTRTDLSKLLPVTVTAKLARSHILFLGYALRDWNLRAILRRIWQDQKLSWNSWAVLLAPDAVDIRYWSRREIELLDIRLEEYIAAITSRLDDLPPV
ncbi:MAG: SIR2 family protein [Myxococcales bacterium]|nr:SIR2 family protein [Myxococcales bacterium]